MSTSTDIEKFGEELNEDELVEIVRARNKEEAVLAALKELARRKSFRRTEIFREVIADPEQGARAKKIVFTNLGTELLPENQELLLQHLDEADVSLFHIIVQSLSKVGDEQALDRLERTQPPDIPHARQSLEFAKSLMSYRFRIAKHLIAKPPDVNLVEVIEGISFEVAEVKLERLRRAIEQVHKDLPAIPLSESGAVFLNCRTTELLLVFTEQLRLPKSFKTIYEQSALPLVLLKKGLSLDHYFLEQYFFTQPASNTEEIDLLGVRPRGELTYVGNIQTSEAGFTFNLRSVDTRHAPAIFVEGNYDLAKDSWQFDKAISSENVATKENKAGIPRKVSPNF